MLLSRLSRPEHDIVHHYSSVLLFHVFWSLLQHLFALDDDEVVLTRHDTLGFQVDLAIDAEDGGIEIPIVESGRTQTSLGIFGRLGMLDADQLRVDVVSELEGEEEKGAIRGGLRGVGHVDGIG